MPATRGHSPTSRPRERKGASRAPRADSGLTLARESVLLGTRRLARDVSAATAGVADMLRPHRRGCSVAITSYPPSRAAGLKTSADAADRAATGALPSAVGTSTLIAVRSDLDHVRIAFACECIRDLVHRSEYSPIPWPTPRARYRLRAGLPQRERVLSALNRAQDPVRGPEHVLRPDRALDLPARARSSRRRRRVVPAISRRRAPCSAAFIRSRRSPAVTADLHSASPTRPPREQLRSG